MATRRGRRSTAGKRLTRMTTPSQWGVNCSETVVTVSPEFTRPRFTASVEELGEVAMSGHGTVARKGLLLRGFGLLLVMSLVGGACGSDSGGNKHNSAARTDAGSSAAGSAVGAQAPSPGPVDGAGASATPDTAAAAPAVGSSSSPVPAAPSSPAAPSAAPGGKNSTSAAPGLRAANASAAAGGVPSAPAASSPSQPARPTPGAPAAPVAPVAGGTIKIGGINPLSGSLSLIGKPAEQAARAYFRSINDAGGVLGQKIDYIVEDDANDANRTRAAAEKLVERDQIFIMGPSFTPYSPDLVPFLESKGVPFIGWDGL